MLLNMDLEGNHSPYTQEVKREHTMESLVSWGDIMHSLEFTGFAF
jgi:hypothetical protein